MNKVKGISLIVLVITIIVMIIIAGAIILSLSNGNVIAKGKEARDLQDFNQIREMIDLQKVNPSLEQRTFDSTDAAAVKAKIPSKYAGIISITDGGSPIIIAPFSDPLTTTRAIEKLGAAYIPNGFTASNATGESTIEEGLVIYQTATPVDNTTVGTARTTLNQFVWVPVDGVSVPYAKWCTSGFSYSTATDDTLPVGITPSGTTATETYQINKYKGFYIARYEASNNLGATLSQKGKTVLADIIYSAAKTRAEAMYNNSYVKSGIVTGTQWDTVMKWLQNSGTNVTDSRTWGNHSNSAAPANVTGFGSVKTSGYSEYWKAKNIYDLAGNTYEWTSEFNSGFIVNRGGCYMGSGNTNYEPATVRSSDGPTDSIAYYRLEKYYIYFNS